jgi:hypothetical protein
LNLNLSPKEKEVRIIHNLKLNTEINTEMNVLNPNMNNSNLKNTALKYSNTIDKMISESILVFKKRNF